MKLVIGNKNYSSWSLRAWLLMRELGIPFDEERISLNAPDFKARVLGYSPAGLVPVLVDGDVRVWDTLAIAEYLAEAFPGRAIWPADREARAMARSISAEMHAGFPALRQLLPMNISARLPGRGWNLRVEREVERVVEIWARARQAFGAGGDLLFGRFGAADAFYAPVVWRLVTYEVPVPPQAERYMAAVQSLASMKEWVEAARAENEYVAMDEPYRPAPTG